MHARERVTNQMQKSKEDKPTIAKCKFLSVDKMTSRDFHSDNDAYITNVRQRLKDTATMEHFRAAIMNNRHLFRGRTVLNVGCGVGVLALFCAKAGAARVIAVDTSSVVEYARNIVAANGYASVVQVHQGHIQTMQTLPGGVEQVDIIVSNWMGHSLLHQSICDAVLCARDRWLRKDGSGLIFPDVAKFFVAGLEDKCHKNDRLDWWTNVYGFNMKRIRELALTEPYYRKVRPSKVITTPFRIKALNLYTATTADFKFQRRFVLEALRSGSLDGLVTYFHVIFSKSHTPLQFSTDAEAPNTQWMQTVLYFDTPIDVTVGQRLCGGLDLGTPDGKPCDLNDLRVEVEIYSGELPDLNLELEAHWNMKTVCFTPKQSLQTVRESDIQKIASPPQTKQQQSNEDAKKTEAVRGEPEPPANLNLTVTLSSACDDALKSSLSKPVIGEPKSKEGNRRQSKEVVKAKRRAKKEANKKSRQEAAKSATCDHLIPLQVLRRQRQPGDSVVTTIQRR